MRSGRAGNVAQRHTESAPPGLRLLVNQDTILRQYESDHNRHRPRRSLHGGAPLKSLPKAVNLDHYRIRRRAHVGDLINEYRLVA